MTATGYDKYNNVITNIEFLWEAERWLAVDQKGKVTANRTKPISLPRDIISWWPGDGNLEDIVPRNNGRARQPYRIRARNN